MTVSCRRNASPTLSGVSFCLRSPSRSAPVARAPTSARMSASSTASQASSSSRGRTPMAASRSPRASRLLVRPRPSSTPEPKPAGSGVPTSTGPRTRLRAKPTVPATISAEAIRNVRIRGAEVAAPLAASARGAPWVPALLGGRVGRVEGVALPPEAATTAAAPRPII